jgi:chromosome condensin MukBEF MukE localization factor
VRRLFWFGAGVAAGVALMRKLNETARKATPSGMAEQLGGAVRELAGAVGSFGAEVRAGMQEREQELHEVVERGSAAAPARNDDTVQFRRIDAAADTGSAGAANGRRARRAGR